MSTGIITDSDISLHLTIIEIDLCRLALTHLLFKLGLTSRHIGTLIHIAALRSSLSTQYFGFVLYATNSN